MISTLYKTFQHWSDRGSVYIISDTHFDDDDCKLMDENWITPEEHISRLKKITNNDTVIHLGDVGNPKYMDQIRGYKVLITGNHDKGAAVYVPYFDEIYTGALIISEKLILSHEPVDIPWLFNIHGHNHNKTICDESHFNCAANVVNFSPINLGELIKTGILSKTQSLHRSTIECASRHSTKEIAVNLC